jgi:hypothetical protein
MVSAAAPVRPAAALLHLHRRRVQWPPCFDICACAAHACKQLRQCMRLYACCAVIDIAFGPRGGGLQAVLPLACPSSPH